MSTSKPQESPRPFVLWTKPIEQDILTNNTAAQIEALLDNKEFAQLQTVTASYDILLAVGDKEKAAELLRLGVASFGKQVMKAQVDETIVILSQEGLSPESQQPFLDFTHEVLFPDQHLPDS